MNFKAYETVGIAVGNTKAVSKLTLSMDAMRIQIDEDTVLRLYQQKNEWAVALEYANHKTVMHPYRGSWDLAFAAFLKTLRVVKYGLDPRAAQYAASLSFEQMKKAEEAIVEACKHATHNTPDQVLESKGYEQTKPGVWTRLVKIAESF